MPTGERITLRAFVARHRIHLTAELVDHNPNMGDDRDEWARTATHWRCRLTVGRRRLTTYFSQGPAIAREPTAEDVLDCLASDSAGIDQPFATWAQDYGYDSDSRRAERLYRVCGRQADQLARWLGPDRYTALLNAERL